MLFIFAVKDLRADCFLTPWFAKNVPEAMRELTQVARDPKTTLNQFASDFALYQLGSLEQKDGHVAPAGDAPIHICIVDALLDVKGKVSNG